MTTCASGGRALSIAIHLRLLVHAALDRNDTPAICHWNRLADAAYAGLSPWEARHYLEWARQYIPDGMCLGARGGDA